MTENRKTRSREVPDVLLATGFSVSDYQKAVEEENATALVSFIQRRFSERYIKPVSSSGRHGFTIMAICCLMIESLVSFRRGWSTTEGNGDRVFAAFFGMHEEFKTLETNAKSFYGHVRNGLLHQAETSGGWRIRRDRGALFESKTKTIEADRFRDGVEAALHKYCDELRAQDWDSQLWRNFRRKVDAIYRSASSR